MLDYTWLLWVPLEVVFCDCLLPQVNPFTALFSIWAAQDYLPYLHFNIPFTMLVPLSVVAITILFLWMPFNCASGGGKSLSPQHWALVEWWHLWVRESITLVANFTSLKHLSYIQNLGSVNVDDVDIGITGVSGPCNFKLPQPKYWTLLFYHFIKTMWCFYCEASVISWVGFDEILFEEKSI